MTAAIIGPRKPSHMDPALAALKVVLSPADTARIEGLLQGAV
jgi:aryl-alcohol dehydrogenase-like predicted oxidoreductase